MGSDSCDLLAFAQAVFGSWQGWGGLARPITRRYAPKHSIASLFCRLCSVCLGTGSTRDGSGRRLAAAGKGKWQDVAPITRQRCTGWMQGTAFGAARPVRPG